jgi:hypothetical protein
MAKERRDKLLQQQPELQALDEQAEPVIYEDLIGRLNQQNVGRGISTFHFDGDFGNEENPPVRKDKLIAYVLPLDADDRKHLTVFTSGEMVVIAPADEDGAETKYKRNFLRNPNPLSRMDVVWPTPQHVIEELRNPGDESSEDEALGSKIVETNDSKKSQPIFEGYIRQSIVTIKEKENREKIRKQGMKFFNRAVNALFESQGNSPRRDTPPQGN